MLVNIRNAIWEFLKEWGEYKARNALKRGANWY